MKPYKLTKENDPRCIEFYQKAFPEATAELQEKMRENWVKKHIKIKK